ncbi:P-loop NTPase [Candidatus Xianfuyuplasma coldseepsis]|uniref:Iron-sulfur cluster carrier protein n=1 Tax=Candidatus Xianfuyuplasma coldseepsis TaxID=2782163 RepID=A0A7L7KTH0_9MOLU|nr:P-loop NTPase [Xianfuyuplasma coldseepsis]QMS85592.1 P-loop NTPase [Xianfuyuplasma coldseepsis]
MYTKEQVRDHINQLVDPSCEKTLAETNGIKHLDIDEEKQSVTLIIGLDDDKDEYKRYMTRQLAKLIKLDLGFKGVKADYQLNKKDDSILSREVKYIGVASGKGGVGKSTVTANLAYALKRLGKKVGIIDADIYGSSIPTILDMDISQPKGTKDGKILPYNVDGIELISTEFFLQPDKPLMWRGPMLGKMLTHFFYDVIWSDDIEYVLVDLPPGTGDVALDITNFIPDCKMIIVTTPHPSASHIAVKAGFAATELKHELLGVVENMSYLDHKGDRLNIFGEGGGKIVADKLKTKVLQSIPIGQPQDHLSIFGMKEPIGIDYLGLANKIMKEL